MTSMAAKIAGRGTVPLFFASSAGLTTGTSVSPAKPTGLSQNMLELAVMASNKTTGATWTGDTGWTEQIDQATLPNLRVATKIAGGSEPGGYTFTASNSEDLSVVILAIKRGVFDAIGAIATRSGGGTLTASGITSAGGMLLAAVVVDQQSAGTVTIASNSGMTLIATGGGSGYPTINIYRDYVVPGATGTRGFTIGGTYSGTSAAVLVGVKRG